MEDADGVGAAADAGEHGVGQAADEVEHLLARLDADDAVEVADHLGEGVRPGDGAEDVVGRLDVGDPVAEGLVDGVLERLAAVVDRHDRRAEQPHPGDVERLALGVLAAHVDDALEPEQRGRGGRRDAVLPGAGLGDDPRLAHPLGEQRLAEHVVDLVRAGVVEVLALEDDPRAAAVLGEARHLGDDARPARVGAVQPLELADELGVDDGLAPHLLELLEGGDQRLGDVASAEATEAAVCRHGGCRGHAHSWVAPLRTAAAASMKARTVRSGCAVADEGLADEHGAGSGAHVGGDVGGSGDAALGHADDALGHAGQQVGDGAGVDLEGLEVAGVDADEHGVERQGPVELGGVVHLDRGRSCRGHGPGRAGRASGRRRGPRR